MDGVVKKGDLVRNTEGAIGIVLDICNEAEGSFWVEVFFGDGLKLFQLMKFLEVIPFKPGAEIPACFIELVNAYERS